MTIFQNQRTGLLISASLLALAAFPGNAAAQNECGPVPPGGGTVTCPTANYPDGIVYQPIEDLTLVLSPGLTTDDGIVVTTGFDGVNLALDAQGDTLVRSSDDGAFAGAGVTLLSALGSVSVNADAVATSGADATGINAGSRNGTIVHADSVTTTGDGATGINAITLNMFGGPAGTVHVESGNVTTSGDNAVGIHASAGDGGDAEIFSDTILTSGEGATGVYATASDGGNVFVGSGTIGTTGDDAAGIYATNYGGGEIAIVSGTVATTGNDFADGIVARGDGAVTITSNMVTVAGDASRGIYAVSNYASVVITSGEVHVAGLDGIGIGAVTGSKNDDDTGYDVTRSIAIYSDQVVTEGDSGTGISATSRNGRVTIDSHSVETGGDGATGILAVSHGNAFVASGMVDTQGDASAGIFVQSDGHATVHSTSVTTQGDNAAGIYAAAYGGGNVVVVSGSVATTGGGSIGLDVHAGGGTGEGNISISSTGITTRGDYAIGIEALAQYGDIVVESGTVATAGRYAPGIYARQDGGGTPSSTRSVTITSADVITTGDHSAGIEAHTADGAIMIGSGTISTTGDGAAGIVSRSLAGANGVASSSIVTSGDRAIGLVATSSSGAVSIDSGRIETSGAGSQGITAYATDYGSIAILSDEIVTHGVGSAGIIANSVLSGGLFAPGDPAAATLGPGDLSIDSGSVRTSGDESRGIVAEGVRVTVTSGMVQTAGEDSDGIDAHSAFGTVAVTSMSVVTTGDISTGIIAMQSHSSPPGLAAGDAPAAGRVGSYPTPGVTVTSGVIRTTGNGSGGIFASSQDGTVSVVSQSVETSGGNSYGIVATAAGRLTIESGTIVTQGDGSTAILANQTAGAGGIGIVSGSITVTGRGSLAIYANSVGGSGAIDITSTGTITTSGLFGAGIIALSDTGAINITSNSILASGNGSFGINAVSVNGAVSIDVTNVRATGAGSDAVVMNGGLGSSLTVRGLVEAIDGVSVQANGGAATLATTATGTIRGHIDLTDNADSVNNAGTFDAIGTSAFGGGSDSFNNSGITRAINGTALFTGLETFSNIGRVELRDGAVGDTLNVGGAFIGGTGSRLGVDADLGANRADVLITAAATGTTILDVNLVGGLALNTDGALVVDAGAGTSATAFTLAGGTQSNPFVTLSLRYDAPANDFLLVSAPDQPVFEQVETAEMATNFWYDSADAVTAQLEAARDGLQPVGTVRSNLTGDGRFGGWVQGVAANIDRDGAQSFNGNIFNTSYQQDYIGVQGGLDYQSGGTILGVTFGYGDADADFDVTGNSVDMKGYNLGAYAAFQSGGFFANGLAKVDWINVDSTPGQNLLARFDATAWGLRGTMGYRFHSGNVFIEPSVSLSYVNVDIDDYTVAGASVVFDNIHSFRGSAGIRFGGDFRQTNGGTWSPFIGLHAIDEFSGDSVAAFTLGQTIGLQQDAPGTFGEAQAGLNYSTGRLEIFARGEYDFGGDRDGLSGRAGVRLRF